MIFPIKMFPRHRLDITLPDMAAALLSFGMPLNKRRLEQDIASFWNREHVRVSFTVRTSLDAILTALDLPPGSEVLMSAITIRDMVQVVLNHKLRVIPIDVRIDDLSVSAIDLEQCISDKTRIVLIAQLFGVIADLQPIGDVCRKKGILLIEDCAQAFCGTNYRGSEYADISMFSFGPIKSSTALGGAVTTFTFADLLKRTAEIERRYPARGEAWFFLRILKYSALILLSHPFAYCMLIKILHRLRKDPEKYINGLVRSFKPGELSAQLRYQAPVRLLYLLRRKLRRNKDRKFVDREQKAKALLGRLDAQYTVPGKTSFRNSFWIIPVLVDNPNALQKQLLQSGFDSTRGNHSLTAVESEDNQDFYAPAAHMMIEKIVYLPNITGMAEKERRKLFEALHSFQG
jgi:perosamine synthetase